MDLISLGWNQQRHDLFESYDARGWLPARVVRIDRGAVQISGSFGTRPAVVAGRLAGQDERNGGGIEDEQPAVGDWVAVDLSEDVAVLRAILPRSSVLARHRPGRAVRVQVAAANVDLVLVVEGLDRGPNRGRIERGTALAWDGGATPVVVLTKTDLCTDLAAAVAKAQAAAPFTKVVAVSPLTGDGAGDLSEVLRSSKTNSTAVLLGPSGAGKSSLVNLLLGSEVMAAAPVRRGDAKGRHTTTSRQLVLLPGGGCLIDTPGVRELGLWLSAEAVDGAFSDITELAAGCRFRDCCHEDEPGCAVRVAVDSGLIDGGRLAAWHKLRREASMLEARTDIAQRMRIKSRSRSIAKLSRQMQQLKKSSG